jgi:hypothetical protein
MKKLILLLTVLSSCVVFKPRPEPRYCVVVDEVIYKKNNTASIRPRSNKKGPEWWTGTTIWFRYPNHNIHRGDTVEITMKDAIGPRF